MNLRVLDNLRHVLVLLGLQQVRLLSLLRRSTLLLFLGRRLLFALVSFAEDFHTDALVRLQLRANHEVVTLVCVLELDHFLSLLGEMRLVVRALLNLLETLLQLTDVDASSTNVTLDVVRQLSQFVVIILHGVSRKTVPEVLVLLLLGGLLVLLDFCVLLLLHKRGLVLELLVIQDFVAVVRL